MIHQGCTFSSLTIYADFWIWGWNHICSTCNSLCASFQVEVSCASPWQRWSLSTTCLSSELSWPLTRMWSSQTSSPGGCLNTNNKHCRPLHPLLCSIESSFQSPSQSEKFIFITPWKSYWNYRELILTYHFHVTHSKNKDNETCLYLWRTKWVISSVKIVIY